MRTWTLLCVAASTMTALIAASLRFSAPATAVSAQRALILYDAPADDPKLGLSYAKMIQGLLGHFSLSADIQTIESYQSGELDAYSTTFYLGSVYNNALPAGFTRDAAQTAHRVVWFKYNFWELAQIPGLNFLGLHGLDQNPTSSAVRPGFYDTVLYKQKELFKYYHFDDATRTVDADPDVGLVRADAGTAIVHSWIKNSKTGDQTPYVVQAGSHRNFWYFADIPLSYIGPRDRYLVFCDLLHDILGQDHAEEHKALVRLEDVDAKVDPSSMQRLSDELSSRKIPFSIAVIPEYRDPLGANNSGQAESISFSKAATLQQSLQYAMAHGGNIVMHGYTHQYGNQKNPHSGTSADDFEFWDAVKNAPVELDSASWAHARLRAGITDLNKFNMSPWAWETPHYQASPIDYQTMAQVFPVSYQRMVYYTSDHPDLQSTSADRDFEAGIFFPFLIEQDPLGRKIIPENLGNIEYDISAVDPSSNVTYTADDIIGNAEYAKIVRDGYASFFFHPFWIDPDFQSLNAFADFKKILDGISAQGYQWADASQL